MVACIEKPSMPIQSIVLYNFRDAQSTRDIVNLPSHKKVFFCAAFLFVAFVSSLFSFLLVGDVYGVFARRHLFGQVAVFFSHFFPPFYFVHNICPSSGSKDKTIRLVTIRTGRVVCSVEAHKGSVEALAYLPDGNTIVSGGTDRTIKTFSPQSRVCLIVCSLARSLAFFIVSFTCFFKNIKQLVKKFQSMLAMLCIGRGFAARGAI